MQERIPNEYAASELVEIPAELLGDFNCLPEDAGPERSVSYFEVSAALAPKSPSKPPQWVVPRGYAFYFSRAINNGWTDNRDAGTRPLEGFDFNDNRFEYIPEAWRARLVAFVAERAYVEYDRRIDQTAGGTMASVNRSAFDWVGRWYINDNIDLYGDNAGTANLDMVIFRV